MLNPVRLPLLCLLATAVILLGCSPKTVPPAVEDAQQAPSENASARIVETPNDESPEAAFNAMRDATLDKDYAAFAAYWTDASQDKLATGLLQGYLDMLDLRSQGKKSNAYSMRSIVESHGIDIERAAALLNNPEISEEDLIAATGALVENKPVFIGDSMALFNKDAPDDKYFQGKLDSVFIEGDNAVGWCVTPDDGVETRINFSNTPDGWRIELPEELVEEDSAEPQE